MGQVNVRYALITGANRGLGLEWIEQLTGSVDIVFAACRRPSDADALNELARCHAETVNILRLDVTASSDIREAADRVERTTGRLDLLVNNAGINGRGTDDRFGQVDGEAMTDVLRVNTVGPHLMTQAFADLLREGAADGSSVVLNVTSQLGSIANTRGGGWHSYKASKAALNMCTRLQAGALKGDGVIVLSIHPGWVRTDMGGSNARLSTEESVQGMINVLGEVTLDDSGQFRTYDGQELPW